MPLLFLEDFTPGQVFGSGTIAVTEADIIAFGRSFDPQPFHLDPIAAELTFFRGLAASGWHTAALSMRLLVDSEVKPAGGIIGAGFEELSWPRAVRPGDVLRLETEVLEVRRSQSRPMQGILKTCGTTYNQDNKVVQVFVGNLILQARTLAEEPGQGL